MHLGRAEPITETCLAATGNMPTRAGQPVSTALLYTILTFFYNNIIFYTPPCIMYQFFVKAGQWGMPMSSIMDSSGSIIGKG